MKNLGIIYLIIVVLLSALPCSDELEIPDLNQNKFTNVAHGKQQGSAESCSPICLCTCCGQSVVEPQLIVFEIKIPTLALESQIANYHCSLTQRAQPIWQPPQLIVNG